MKGDTETAPPVGWTSQRERSSLPMLILMRRIALAAGRRLSRALLHPIVLYFLVAAADTRRHSRAYLNRALGRKAGWLDVYRHLFTFAATVLDRVYLLREEFGRFKVEASGAETLMQPFANGEGVLACGAHLGSFEALRMIGHEKGLRVAMIMYEDNARLINDTLAAIAPNAKLHTIALGRVDAMLSLRRWLDEGGIAGMLADRTLPGQGQRSKSVSLLFLGKPARFADGPFRLAAMLRRKVVFMAGLYRGGHRYELRFAELADFSAVTAEGRDAAIRDALVRYVATLETLCREVPYNWFNFYDFWAEDDAPAEAPTTAHTRSPTHADASEREA
jgi:predicted LPLAT superfamily acyltransferase